jgi:bifunctional DNA-binding transcriptional regulator/antitoxin component of YhaV-PrlF toxin-antitoxin module
MAGKDIDSSKAVTLEVSALQYFPWLITEAKQSIEQKQLLPGRFIRVRNMAEQEKDNGDTIAIAAAMQIIGASYVETLDTKGTDGSNIHLGGPETITGYFGGIGQPNDYPFKWVDEYLHFYTNYGIKQVLNINPGTVLTGYLLHKLGIDNEFKISVFMGNDNPMSILWTLMAARLFSRQDGTTSLIGFNLANSVNNTTIREAAEIRKALDLEQDVRLEHHITETYKSIVIQPYNRRQELIEVAKEVPNIAAKHEGGDPEIDGAREHPSDILDYFLSKEDTESQGLMDMLLTNYLDKHNSLNKTAEALTKAGIGVVCAWNAHK